jgi:hypothetical protein
MAKKKAKQKPVETLRDGLIKATIWANRNDEGQVFFSTSFTRSYKTDDGFKDTNGYSGAQLLRLAKLAEKAYDRENYYRQLAKAENAASDEPGDEIPF